MELTRSKEEDKKSEKSAVVNRKRIIPRNCSPFWHLRERSSQTKPSAESKISRWRKNVRTKNDSLFAVFFRVVFQNLEYDDFYTHKQSKLLHGFSCPRREYFGRKRQWSVTSRRDASLANQRTFLSASSSDHLLRLPTSAFNDNGNAA